MDPQAFRTASRERWEAVAAGWGARRDFHAAAEPVSRWMVDAIAPEPGHVVLELAAGPGDTGLLAAQRIAPGGRLVLTDGAEAMVAVARERAAELGLENVEARAMEAEWIDLPTASVDGALCRWGYMLLADPEAALRETRRVLRPGGRVALATWAAADENPWSFGAVLADQGLVPPPQPGEPGPFALSVPAAVEELLGATGFAEVVVEPLDFAFTAPSYDEWVEAQLDLSPSLSGALAAATPEQRDAFHDAAEERLADFRDGSGALRIPARALVAGAEA